MDEKNKLLEACKFSMNEIVLCYEPDPIKARMLYDAKILDADVTKDEKGKKVFEYYIHFQGWNKSWDRWILENQILKANETNRTLQTKLYNEAIRQKKRKPKSSKHESGDEKDDKSVTSMGSVNSDDVKVIQLPMVFLDIPKVLAVRLEDDCYNIKRKKKLIHLPRKPTVNEIFNEYYAYCEKIVKTPEGRNMSLKVIYEMVHGLNTYFNYFLFSLLLYNFEREQYHNFFPEQEKQTDGFSPTATPVTPKLVSPNSIGFSDSSRSNSRTSSFCEEGFNSVSAPLLKEVLKTKSNRKRRSEGKSLSVDETSTQGGTTKRKRNTASCSAMGGSKESSLVNTQNPTVELDGKLRSRETRSTKKAVPPEKEEVYPKEEKAIKPMEILEENIIDMKRTTTRSKTYGHKEDVNETKESSSTSKRKNGYKDANEIKQTSSTSKKAYGGKEDQGETKQTSTSKKTYGDKGDQGETKQTSTSKKTYGDKEDQGDTKQTSTSKKTYGDKEDRGETKQTSTSKKTYGDKEDQGETKETSTSKKTYGVKEDQGETKQTSTSKKTYGDKEDQGETKESSTSKEEREADNESNRKSVKKDDEKKEQSIAADELKEDNETVEYATTDSCFDNAPLSSMENNSNRLRRSMRSQKCPNTVCESDEQETLPMGSTAKSLQETYKGPLKLSNKPQGRLKESDGRNDKTFMIYPQLSNGDTPADIYGLEHLLRLFLKLPVLLSSSNIDEPKMVVILQYVSQFLEYLSKRTDLFVDSASVYSESII